MKVHKLYKNLYSPLSESIGNIVDAGRSNTDLPYFGLFQGIRAANTSTFDIFAPANTEITVKCLDGKISVSDQDPASEITVTIPYTYKRFTWVDDASKILIKKGLEAITCIRTIDPVDVLELYNMPELVEFRASNFPVALKDIPSTLTYLSISGGSTPKGVMTGAVTDIQGSNYTSLTSHENNAEVTGTLTQLVAKFGDVCDGVGFEGSQITGDISVFVDKMAASTADTVSMYFDNCPVGGSLESFAEAFNNRKVSSKIYVSCIRSHVTYNGSEVGTNRYYVNFDENGDYTITLRT